MKVNCVKWNVLSEINIALHVKKSYLWPSPGYCLRSISHEELEVTSSSVGMNKLENSFPIFHIFMRRENRKCWEKLSCLIGNTANEYRIAVPVQSVCRITVKGVRHLQVAENLVCCKDYKNPNFVRVFRVINLAEGNPTLILVIRNVEIILQLVPQTQSSVAMFN